MDGGCWVRRQRRKGWEMGVLKGFEAGEIDVYIVFAIKKRAKGRKPRKKGQKPGMQDVGGWRLGPVGPLGLFPQPTVPKYTDM